MNRKNRITAAGRKVGGGGGEGASPTSPPVISYSNSSLYFIFFHANFNRGLSQKPTTTIINQHI